MRRAAIAGAAVAAILSSQAGLADQARVSSKARSTLFSSQTKFLDDRAASQYSYSTRLMPETDFSGTLYVPNKNTSKFRATYLPIAEQAARKYRVPVALFARLVRQESNWNPTARSHKGAIGLAQLMPHTARILGVNPTDPVQNLHGGARYLRQQYDRFGSWQLALAAYNAGPGAVQKHKGVPPYRETQNYVLAILGQPG